MTIASHARMSLNSTDDHNRLRKPGGEEFMRETDFSCTLKLAFGPGRGGDSLPTAIAGGYGEL